MRHDSASIHRGRLSGIPGIFIRASKFQLRLPVSAIILVCLMLLGMSFQTPSMAQEAAKTVMLNDGEGIFVPEIKLTRRVTPVDTLLFVGAWRSPARAKGKGNLAPLCEFDLDNNSILIKTPEKLLEKAQVRVVTRQSLNHHLDKITWLKGQSIHYAFLIISNKIQPAVVEIYSDSDAALYNNGKLSSSVSAASAVGAGGLGYLPVMLKRGVNVISIRQYTRGVPNIQVSVCLDNSLDLKAAWQSDRGLLKSLVCLSKGRDDVPELRWNPDLGKISLALEVRNVSTNEIVLRKESVRRGKLIGDDGQSLVPGIYEITYKAGGERNSELFIVGDPNDLFEDLQKELSQYNPDSNSKLNIEAHLRRARILLSKDNYKITNRGWQAKATYTLNCLAEIERELKAGAVNTAKSGLHIRGFASSIDGSFQSCRLFVPSNYNPDVPIPLLVIVSTGVANAKRSFLEGPAMANLQQARLWSRYADKHGFALLWSGYRGVPRGYAYESVHINDAIRNVEKNYTINPGRISVFATCGAGYNAGRLVTEYPNRFAAIVYDRAVFDLSLDKIKTLPSLVEWYTSVNPSRHVINNRNLRVFVLHDGTKPAGHGPLELTTKFLDQAAKTRDDVVSHLAKQPMTQASRLDKLFTWLSSCNNENPSGQRSYFSTEAGYTGPIMEIFATPLIVVEGTQAQSAEREAIQQVVESLRLNYKKHFHDAECVVKKDTEVTQDDINKHSLILVGNPQSNSVWEKLESRLVVKTTPAAVMYGNDRLAGFQPFQAIVRHPAASDKYILLIGAGDLRTLDQVKTDNLFNAWYDCLVFDSPFRIISKLDN